MCNKYISAQFLKICAMDSMHTLHKIVQNILLLLFYKEFWML